MSILAEAMEKPVIEMPEKEAVQDFNGPSFTDTILEILRIKKGAGAIKEYQESPLCFDGSEGMAQMLRAITGVIGADVHESAVLDFLIGLFKWLRGRKAGDGVA